MPSIFLLAYYLGVLKNEQANKQVDKGMDAIARIMLYCLKNKVRVWGNKKKFIIYYGRFKLPVIFWISLPMTWGEDNLYFKCY